jgi:5-oxoprolinase (ATP-hydrolysing)
MGGTSTDVSLLEAGELPAQLRDRGRRRARAAPMLRVHTVAAGGGSLCRFDGFRFTVGPRARARAGPTLLRASRTRASSRSPTRTLALGRVQPDRFPVSARGASRVDAALDAIARSCARGGRERTRERWPRASSRWRTRAWRRRSRRCRCARGVDPRECALVGFGGAGGQHVCAVARSLGMRDVLLHPLAGILSAWGIGISGASWDWPARRAARAAAVRGAAARRPCARRSASSSARARGAARGGHRRERDPRRAAARPAPRRHRDRARRSRSPRATELASRVRARARERFGYTRPGHAIEITAARVRVFERGATAPPAAARRARRAAQPRRSEPVWFPGVGRVATPVYWREDLAPGTRSRAPR